MRASSFLLALSLPLALAACSSRDASIFDEPSGTPDAAVDTATGGGGDTGGGALDTGSPSVDTGVVTDTPAPAAVTLDNVCERLPDAYCTEPLGACCKAEGLAWNESGCRTTMKTVCEARVKAVKAGQATFNAGAFVPCQNAWKNMVTRCNLPILDFVENQAFCAQLFVGTVPPGGGCGDDWQCKVAPGAVPNCNSSNRCETTTIADKDQPCAYSGAVRSVCDYGLACQFSSGATGTCKAAKSVGAACNSSAECGFGFYCDGSSPFGAGKCAKGLPLGAGCFNNETCESGTCSSGRCTDPNVSPISNFVCNGAG